MKISRNSEVLINGLRWTISECDKVPHSPKGSDQVGMGRCYTATLHIYVLETLPKDNFNKTLAHEVSHAFFYSCGFDQVDFNQEVACDFVSTYVFQIAKLCDDYMKERGNKK